MWKHEKKWSCELWCKKEFKMNQNTSDNAHRSPNSKSESAATADAASLRSDAERAMGGLSVMMPKATTGLIDWINTLRTRETTVRGTWSVFSSLSIMRSSASSFCYLQGACMRIWSISAKFVDSIIWRAECCSAEASLPRSSNDHLEGCQKKKARVFRFRTESRRKITWKKDAYLLAARHTSIEVRKSGSPLLAYATVTSEIGDSGSLKAMQER